MSILSRSVSVLFFVAFTSLALVGCGSSGGGGDIDPDGGGGVDSGVDDSGNPYTCNDGLVTGAEACDDGNNDDGDGCSGDCSTIEDDFACPSPGDDCVRIVTCGNGKIEGSETCDDGDTTGGDGCSATCQLESGWTCILAGTACVATECGDGIVAGFEICDDGNDVAPGCDANCQLEEGYHCPTEGMACSLTTCGDGMVQGTEECDDQNLAVGDGCTPFCKLEPNCADGTCTAVCGDGVRWAPEACDDGNTQDGDGCSADCATVEQGFTCMEVPLPDPAFVDLPVTYRDFVAACTDTDSYDGRLEMGEPGAAVPYGHADFECYGGSDTDMVLVDLDGEGKPVLDPPNTSTVSSAASFAQWYRDTPDYNLTRSGYLRLDEWMVSGQYQFDGTSFFPLTGDGWDVVDCSGSPCEDQHDDGNSTGYNNFHFTSEVRFWFEYEGGEVLHFSGDDDVWVFINGKLAVDIGGVHGRQDDSISLDDCDSGDPMMNDAGCISALDLTIGGIYEAVVFQAERHTTRSQYRLTLTNFNRAPSDCDDSCGDGVVSSYEQCDDMGATVGEYGGCAGNCTFEPYCGDGNTDMAFGETCDDGTNLGGSASACSPGCMSMGAICGDGVVQTDDGEECDDGNTTTGDGCSAICKLEFE